MVTKSILGRYNKHIRTLKLLCSLDSVGLSLIYFKYKSNRQKLTLEPRIQPSSNSAAARDGRRGLNIEETTNQMLEKRQFASFNLDPISKSYSYILVKSNLLFVEVEKAYYLIRPTLIDI